MLKNFFKNNEIQEQTDSNYAYLPEMDAIEVFPCGRCGKTFSYLYALKRHKKSCNANKPRKCRKCLRWFESQLCATRHELHCFNDNTPLACKFCLKTFEHLYMLQRHYRSTHRIKMSTSTRKQNYDSYFDKFIGADFPNSEESCPQTCSNQENEPAKPSTVYTIEIESINNDSDVQTLVYNIRQTTDTEEIEVLPECEISDFDNVLLGIDNDDSDAIQQEQPNNYDEIHDVDIKLEGDIEIYDNFELT